MSSRLELWWKLPEITGELGYFLIIPTSIAESEADSVHELLWTHLTASRVSFCALFSTFGGDCTWYVTGARVADVGFPCAVTRVRRTKGAPRGHNGGTMPLRAKVFSAISSILQLLFDQYEKPKQWGFTFEAKSLFTWFVWVREMGFRRGRGAFYPYLGLSLKHPSNELFKPPPHPPIPFIHYQQLYGECTWHDEVEMQ